MRYPSTLLALPLALLLVLAGGAARAQGGKAPEAEASAAPLANPVANRGVPWPFVGFVVKVPDVSGLYSQSRTGEGARLFRVAANPLRTWTFTAHLLKPNRPFTSARELVEYMRAGREIGDPKRITKRSHRETAYEHASAPCARYAVEATDRGERVDEAASLFMRGMTCVHPQKADLLVDLGYAERGAVDDVSPELAKAGEQFVTSLGFLPLEPPMALRTAIQRQRVGDMSGAVEELRPLALAGNTRAAAVIGAILMQGSGVPADPAEAMKFLEVAASGGWVDALFNLGAIYDRGFGVPRDPEAAAKWLTLAADQRDGQSQLNLGVYEWNGENAKRDPRKACDWWRMAAGNGNTRAGLLFRDNSCRQLEPQESRQ